MSLYADYIKEREGYQIIETDQGFATYIITDRLFEDNTIYLRDIYVSPSHRMTQEASTLANKVAEIGRINKCYHMIGSVCLTSKTVTENIKVILAYGMEYFDVAVPMMYFRIKL
jgi:hypothetical protein